MSDNKKLSALFDEIADLLEITGEQSFRVNSYRRAARAFKDMTRDIAAMLASGELAQVPGIGKGTLDKVKQFFAGGSIDLHVELQLKVPSGLTSLLKIPGLGPKKAALFWKEHGVESLETLVPLLAAFKSGEKPLPKGLGEKTIDQILAGISFNEKSGGRTPLGVAVPIAEEMLTAVRGIKGVRQAEVAGSLRRGCETIGDIDILCEAADGAKVIQSFTALPPVKRVLARGDTKGSVVVERSDGAEIQIDLRVVPAESFGAALQYFTGSKEHNVRLRERAVKKKWKLNEWGLFDGETQLAGKTEASIYKKLGVPFPPPEMREDRGEFDEGPPIKLIERGDIRGDLHMHTTASDGTVDAEGMARAAHALGYEYIAITDHSKSSAIANGLTIDRMWRQIERLRELNRNHDAVSILVGCECDILADGSLDYPDQILAACDIVVASIHAGMKQERKKITHRLLKAMENPYVTIMGHPTARLINRREPMDLDMEEVIKQAANTHTALELNCSWQRLDLKDVHVRMARDAGVMIAIDTDSHAPIQMEQMRFGIATARRGWLTAEDVLNTRPLFALRKWIAKKRKAK